MRWSSAANVEFRSTAVSVSPVLNVCETAAPTSAPAPRTAPSTRAPTRYESLVLNHDRSFITTSLESAVSNSRRADHALAASASTPTARARCAVPGRTAAPTASGAAAASGHAAAAAAGHAAAAASGHAAAAAAGHAAAAAAGHAAAAAASHAAAAAASHAAAAAAGHAAAAAAGHAAAAAAGHAAAAASRRAIASPASSTGGRSALPPSSAGAGTGPGRPHVPPAAVGEAAEIFLGAAAAQQQQGRYGPNDQSAVHASLTPTFGSTDRHPSRNRPEGFVHDRTEDAARKATVKARRDLSGLLEAFQAHQRLDLKTLPFFLQLALRKIVGVPFEHSQRDRALLARERGPRLLDQRPLRAQASISLPDLDRRRVRRFGGWALAAGGARWRGLGPRHHRGRNLRRGRRWHRSRRRRHAGLRGLDTSIGRSVVRLVNARPDHAPNDQGRHRLRQRALDD